MWTKLAVGALAGLVCGFVFPPGYAFWVVLGVVAGYLAHAWAMKRRRARSGSGEAGETGR